MGNEEEGQYQGLRGRTAFGMPTLNRGLARGHKSSAAATVVVLDPVEMPVDAASEGVAADDAAYTTVGLFPALSISCASKSISLAFAEAG